MAELVIAGGLVVDGTGMPPVERDVIVSDGRIIDVVPPGVATTLRRIDATGLVVAPGFIDVHTHSDVSVLLDGRAESKVRQGVTTEVTGNCGFSPFPLTLARRREHLDLLAGIGDDPVDPSWTDLAGYADAVEQSGTAVNLAPLVGHGQLRVAAMGMGDHSPAAHDVVMRRTLAALLEQGAFGLSSGLTYVPSCYAGEIELASLCSVVASYDALYATHARGAGAADIDEAARLGRGTGVRVQFSHVAINEPQNWGTAHQLLDRFAEARRAGVDIAFDVYPYDASASALTQYLPAWVQDGGIDAMRQRLADSTTMARAETELARGWGHNGAIPWLWDRVVLARTDGVLSAVDGQTIEQAATDAGLPPARYVLELCREGGNRVQVVLFYRTENDMRTFLRSEWALVGSDGSALPYEQDGRRPHPRSFGAHVRVLGRYVREFGDLDVTSAVQRMTGAVARRLGLTDRGVIAPDKVADVVVFDPATVSDQATYLDPAQPPVGVTHVLVNGELVVVDGVQTPARPGKVLRAR